MIPMNELEKELTLLIEKYQPQVRNSSEGRRIAYTLHCLCNLMACIAMRQEQTAAAALDYVAEALVKVYFGNAPYDSIVGEP